MKTVFCKREFYWYRTKYVSDRHQQSIFLFSRWLVLKILVISTWFGVWLVNCIRFSWIIVGFLILTKLLAYTFFLEHISPSLIFLMQKLCTFFKGLIFNSFYWENFVLLRDICVLSGSHLEIGRINTYALFIIII